MIVEDDRMVAAINSQYAERTAGIQVVAVFHNGKDALAFLESAEVDLLLLDLYMPDLSGLEVLEAIRKHKRRIDVIMITAANDTSSLGRALRLGITDYLVKPFQYERFAQAMDKVVMRRKIVASGMDFTQEDVDKILSAVQPREASKVMELEKGLQRATLEKIRAVLRENYLEMLTADFIASQTSLSKITVRRYLNFLIENHEVSSTIDYSTGGRPRMLYQWIETDL